MATDIIVGQLLENAFKYSPDGGTVAVAARHAGDWIEVSVEDEGIGIAPGDHERIFERFVQGETGDRRRFGGIGLGLYIVRQLARAQGGEVAASSRRPGAPGCCSSCARRPADRTSLTGLLGRVPQSQKSGGEAIRARTRSG